MLLNVPWLPFSQASSNGMTVRVLMESPLTDHDTHSTVPITLDSISLNFSLSSIESANSQSMDVDLIAPTPLSTLVMSSPLSQTIKEMLHASLETFCRNLSVKFPLIFNRAWATVRSGIVLMDI